MKRERTLRKTLVFVLILAFVLPLCCFAMISQMRIWDVSYSYMNESIDNDIRSMDTTLNLVLEKYATLLYDFCTDEDVIRLVEDINGEQDVLDTSSSQLRRELIHVCNRNDGVEGITLVTESGEVFFYDRVMASSNTSTWAGVVRMPEILEGEVFQGIDEAVRTDDEEFYLYQIGRRLVDYRDINRRIGSVILSVNTKTLEDVFSAGDNSTACIAENGRILLSTDPSLIRQDISAVSTENMLTRNAVNEKSGWGIYDYHSMELYRKTFAGQAVGWGIVTLLMVLLLVGSIFYITNPMLRKVEDLVQAMNRVEAGDFDVQVSRSGRIPYEIKRIVDGFNQMVRQLEKLIAQVRQSATDQKNAEISAMEAQIDPHFLYNTLDTINWKAIEAGQYEISGMVGCLADIMRYAIRNPGGTASIGQVLYWMSQYTSLQSKKLEAPLRVEVDVPEEVKNYRIHKLLLQPIVENAFRHGFWHKEETCVLEVSIHETDGQLHIVVKDNGKGMPPETLARLNDETADLSGHVGIGNVRTRLKLYYGDDAGIYFESREGSYTKVHLFVKAVVGEETKHEDCGSGG